MGFTGFIGGTIGGDARAPDALQRRAALDSLYPWIIDELFLIRVALGYAHTFYADTVIDFDRGVGAGLAEAHLDDALASHGLAPEFQVAVGYRY